MAILIINIKELVQVEDKPVLLRKGKEMSELKTIKNAWLFIEDNKIAAFGKMDEQDLLNKAIEAKEFQIIDATGKMLFPSFCDSHTHLVYAGSREIEYIDKIKGLSYEEIAKRGGGILNSAARLHAASEDELINSAMERLSEIISYGTGAVEIGEGGVLYSDDLIEDLEESLNVERLNNKYDAYLNQLKDRKKQGALELMVGTRWNVLDPLGRIQNQYADNPKYRFRVIPEVDENGHSNFNYDYGVGFDDAYYADMKASIDDATWWAKYMGKPYVREGLLFPADELRYFNGVLPDGEPDRKLMVMDIAWGGGDFTACPIAYVYGDAVFIPDLVFNNGDKTVTRPEVVGKIIQHKINVVRGEANNGGDEYCDVVDSQLRQQGYHCSVRSQRAPSGQSKLSRIIQYAPDIKRFYFLDEKHQSKEYKAFMEQVTMFTQLGKVPHDDAPDSLAQLADELYNGISKIEPVKRPF